ncbi:MAG: hypothetical protein K6L74_07505 [Neptuniibacter sp.]
MSEATKLQPLTMLFQGKITQARQYQGKHYTRVVTPAPDQYSQPSSFEIRSSNLMGHIGQEVSGYLTMSGYVRERPYTDKNTGEMKTASDKVVFLDLVEA